MYKVVIKEIDYDDYRIGLTDGVGAVFIFRTTSEAAAYFCKDCMEAALKAGEKYRRTHQEWKLVP